MSISVFVVVLVAAVLNATWNAVVKGGSDKQLTTALVTIAGALIAAIILPFLPIPARASWPFLGASLFFQVAFFMLVARTYQVADMSLAYPLMRGMAPLVVTFVTVVALGESLSVAAGVGIALLCAGVLGMTGGIPRGSSARGVSLALLNAVVIAGYTMIDGAGVRRSGSPASYTLWLCLLTGVPFAVWVLRARRAAFTAYAARHWFVGLVGGVGTLASYGLALWAMTRAPIALVAALRETSILAAMMISVWLLGERVGLARILAACLIVVGAIVLRFA